MPSNLPNRTGARAVLVWDAPTRLFHWLLVALIAVSWTTGSLGNDWLRLPYNLRHLRQEELGTEELEAGRS